MWSNWSGTASVEPRRRLAPRSVAEVADAVLAARREGIGVKMVGSGHSFTDIAVTDGLLLEPGGLRGVVGVDRDAMTVTVLAGTPLYELNATLEHLGLSLHNMGDIDRQTIAGATATGTHGTGGVVAGLATQIAGLDLVTGDGTAVRADDTENADLFRVARVGLGALGILTSLTLRVEPLFALEAHEAPMGWDQALATFEEECEQHHHYEMYWFPHTDRLAVKRNDRTVDGVEPLSAWRYLLEDEILANGAFDAAQRLGNRLPRLVPPLARMAADTLSERRYSDVAHRVFTSRRRVRFKEMEYAVPAAAGMTALAEVRHLIEASDWRISFPVEVRRTPGDDIPLSMASGRESVYLAFHVNHRTDHTTYFAAVEQVMRAHGGRPHWGKLHTLTAPELATHYAEFDDVLAWRDKLDPDRVFGNAYLTRVLGP